MCVDRGIPGSASEGLAVTVGNMLACLGVTVTLAQSVVNHVTDLFLLLETHQEVVGLHVTVQEVVLVQELDAGDHLVCEHAHRFQRKLLVTVLKQVLQ